jgi:hypothetical protein
MTRLLARWRQWRHAAGVRACTAGRHRWTCIAHRIYCKRCSVFYPDHPHDEAPRD